MGNGRKKRKSRVEDKDNGGHIKRNEARERPLPPLLILSGSLPVHFLEFPSDSMKVAFHSNEFAWF